MTPQEAINIIKEKTGYDCHVEKENPIIIQGGHSRDVTGWVFGYEDAFVISQFDTSGKVFVGFLPDDKSTECQWRGLEEAVDAICENLIERQEEINAAINKELASRVRSLEDGSAKTISFDEMMEDMKGWDKQWEKEFDERISNAFERHPEFGTVLKDTRVSVASLLRAFNLGIEKNMIAQCSGLDIDKITEALEVLAIALVQRKELP